MTARAPLVEPSAAGPARRAARPTRATPVRQRARDPCRRELGVAARGTMLPLQAKLEVGAVDDPLEHEAERVARQVMRMPSSDASPPRCACGGVAGPDGECAACRAKRLARVAVAPSAPALHEAPPSVDATLAGPGQALDVSTRAFFEPRLGVDLGAVRVHDDGAAHASAHDVAARAYTVGNDIVFGAGLYRPGSEPGRALLAHELAHVMQQDRIGSRVQRQPASEGATVTTTPAPGGKLVKVTASRQLSGREVYLLTVTYGRNVNREKALKLIEQGTEVGCIHPVCETGLQAGEGVEVFFGPPQGAGGGGGAGEQAAQRPPKPLPTAIKNALDNPYVQGFIDAGRREKLLRLSPQQPSAADYEAILSVRSNLLALGTDELACYRRWVAGRTPTGWAAIAKSLEEFAKVKIGFCDPMDLKPLGPLAGKEELYAKIKAVEALERKPTHTAQGAVDEKLAAELAEARKVRDAALAAANFKDVRAFNEAANEFRVYFRDRALRLLTPMLGHARRVLSEAFFRYQIGHKPDVLLMHQVPKEAEDLYDQLSSYTSRSKESLEIAHPILRGGGALRATSRATSAYEFSWRLTLYAAERLRDLHFLEGHLRRDPDVVFKFDAIVEATAARMGLKPESIHAAIIAEQRGKPGEPLIWRLIDIALLLLSFVPGPIGATAAAVSATREIGGAITEYEQQMRAYELGLRDEPSAAPIAMAVVTNLGPQAAIAGVGRTWRFVKGARVGTEVAEESVAAAKATGGDVGEAAAKTHVPPTTAPTLDVPTIAKPDVPPVAKPEPPKVTATEPDLPKAGKPEPELPPKTAKPEADVPPKAPTPEPDIPPKTPAPEPDIPPKAAAVEPELPPVDPRLAKARTQVAKLEKEAADAAAVAKTAEDALPAARQAKEAADAAVVRAREEVAIATRARNAAKRKYDRAGRGERRAARSDYVAARDAADALRKQAKRLATRADRAADAVRAAERTAERRAVTAAEKAGKAERARERAVAVEKAVTEGEVPRLQPGDEFSLEKRRPELSKGEPTAGISRGPVEALVTEVRILPAPLLTKRQLARQRKIMELAKKNPQQAGNEYSKLIGEAEGWTDIAEMTTHKYGQIGRRPDFGNVAKEVTIEGRSGPFSTHKLDQLWEDLKLGRVQGNKPTIDLTVPKLSPEAERQLAKLADEWKRFTGEDALILVRETLP